MLEVSLDRRTDPRVKPSRRPIVIGESMPRETTRTSWLVAAIIVAMMVISSPALGLAVAPEGDGQADTVTASIDTTLPASVLVGEDFVFLGHAEDSLGHSIDEFEIRSSLDGTITATQSPFFVQMQTPGTHLLYFRARCFSGIWSPDVTRTVAVLVPTSLSQPVQVGAASSKKGTTLTGKTSPPHAGAILLTVQKMPSKLHDPEYVPYKEYRCRTGADGRWKLKIKLPKGRFNVGSSIEETGTYSAAESLWEQVTVDPLKAGLYKGKFIEYSYMHFDGNGFGGVRYTGTAYFRVKGEDVAVPCKVRRYSPGDAALLRLSKTRKWSIVRS